MRNLRILDNAILQGLGAPMMSIFLEDNSGGGYRDVEICRNIINQAHAHGIFGENMTGRIDENRVSWSGTGRAHNDTPRIRPWGNSHDLSLRGNVGLIELQKGQDKAQQTTIKVAA